MTAIYLLSIRQLAGKWRLLILLALCALPFAVAGVPHGWPTDSADAGAARRRPARTACSPPRCCRSSSSPSRRPRSATSSPTGRSRNLTLTPIAHWRIALPKLLAAITRQRAAARRRDRRRRPARVPLVALDGRRQGGGGGGARDGGRRRRSTRRSSSGPASSPSHPLAFGLLYVFVWEGPVRDVRERDQVPEHPAVHARDPQGGRRRALRRPGPGTWSASAPAIVGVGRRRRRFAVLVVRRLRRMDVP